MMKSVSLHDETEKGSYKRDEREVGNGCNVYVKEMDGRLEREL